MFSSYNRKFSISFFYALKITMFVFRTHSARQKWRVGPGMSPMIRPLLLIKDIQGFYHGPMQVFVFNPF